VTFTISIKVTPADEARLDGWIHETGSLTADRLEITESDASKHVWKGMMGDADAEVSESERNWKRNQNRCDVCFTYKSSSGRCMCNE
jgi:hypothetical protein